jgi:HAE1 family hydrophobic/amphiphilic exporter-1
MGLVTKNAILLVDFANQAVAAGKSRIDALLEAGQVRLRPILMTTAAMIFGMLPLALGLGEGGSQRAPMAHAVIGGLITSTLLTLIVVPVIYTYTEQLGAWALKRLRPATPHQAPPLAAGAAAH